VLRYGRYLFLNVHHLEWTKSFFERHGGKTIFISRFIPVVRHLISIPAGLARMSLGPFLLYTFVGATLWNGFLTYLGVRLKENWRIVQQYTHILDYLVAAALLAGTLYLFWKLRAAWKAARNPEVSTSARQNYCWAMPFWRWTWGGARRTCLSGSPARRWRMR